jgi:ABC-type phosphate/phosphonate transport system substrate-binding protein
MIANARMYSVAPSAAAAWRRLLEAALAHAGLDWPVVEHAWPAPIQELWARDDLGCAFMCGLPFARRRPRPTLIAVPIPSPARYHGRPVYFTDFIVRQDAPFTRLEDTFGARLAWTSPDSHSGCNAVRHHLLSYRSPERPRLYAVTVGPLATPRRVLEAIAEARADVGPIDSYAFALLQRHEPALAGRVRVVASTKSAPIPPLVATAFLDAGTTLRLRAGLSAASPELRAELLLDGFAAARPEEYDGLETLARAAAAAGYPLPA